MSVMGPRGGRARGRGSGRGRGRGKTMVWEWESYTPGPEVYDQLWHIRKEPATVTPYLPTECPIPNAQTRISDRRQSEGDIQRNFYIVETTHFHPRNSSVSSGQDAAPSSTEIVHVDLSRILEYVSPDELERFENEQFKIEAEAEAIAKRVEAEELAQRRLEKNARAPGAGRGSRILGGLGLDAEVRTRGRPRWRGRGRGRGNWRGRGALVMNNQLRNEDMQELLVDVEPMETLRREEDMELVIAETESDEGIEAHARAQTSPGIARSAFFANSALSMSPVASLRRPSGIPIIQRGRPKDTVDGSDLELVDADARSMSSAAMQLRTEDDSRGRSDDISEDESLHRDRHRRKRRRAESIASNQRIPPARTALSVSNLRRAYPETPFAPSIPESSDAGSYASDEAIPAQPPVAVYRSLLPRHTNGTDVHSGGADSHSPIVNPPVEQQNEEEGGDEDEDEDAEEYAVEAIIEHYRESGKTYYLVKWQGYQDSHDWLPEEDLEGAAELVAEYNERVKRRKGEQKMAK